MPIDSEVVESSDGVDAEPAEPEGELDLAGAPEASCDPEIVGSDLGPTVVIYEVDDGQLGSVCLGEAIAVIEESWLLLTEITPPEQLGAVERFAGFESRPGGDTLAFVAPLPLAGPPDDEAGDEGGGGFLIAVDLASSEGDESELLVTMAHEISHVFTQVPGQLDRTIVSDDCDTYDNGLGCFTEDSFMAAWIDAFWSEDDLASLPVDGSADEDAGEERCELDAAFIGSYGASHPEEDFAESFAAYVLDVDVRPAVQARVDFFEQFPELVAFRDRAAAAGLSPLVGYQFEPCG